MKGQRRYSADLAYIGDNANGVDELMIQKENSRLKLPVLAVYLMLLYGIWTVWEFFVKPNIGVVIQNEYLSQFVKSGVIKNLVWTLPAILLIKHFESDMYVGLREMFTTKVRWVWYLPVFLLFIIYLIGGAALTKGKIAISETFGFADVIVVLFVAKELPNGAEQG